MSKLLIGLTGPIGAGKSHVASVWQSLGAGVVEGDAMGKLALERSVELRTRLAEAFGDGILDADRKIINSELARVAFATPDNTQLLTDLTFPILYKLAREHFEIEAKSHDIVVFDAALIFEWGVEDDFDKIVTVTASEDRLLTLAKRRLGVDESAVRQRLSHQLPADVKVRRADFLIVNDGTLDDLTEKAKQVWTKIN